MTETIERNGKPDLQFNGERVASTSNSPDRGHSDWSGETGRWTALSLYRTDSGKYVCHRVERTQWQGERDTHTAAVCDSVDGVREFFGYSDLAKEIYHEAGIQAAEVV